MKKMIALTLCAMLTLSVCACGNNTKESESAVNSTMDTSSDPTAVTILGKDPAT